MANISIWNGSSTFAPGQTPFGFYDSDPEFAAEADRLLSVKLEGAIG